MQFANAPVNMKRYSSLWSRPDSWLLSLEKPLHIVVYVSWALEGWGLTVPKRFSSAYTRPDIGRCP